MACSGYTQWSHPLSHNFNLWKFKMHFKARLKFFTTQPKKVESTNTSLPLCKLVQIYVPVRTWKLGLEQQRPLVQQGGVRCVCKTIPTVIVWLDEQRLTKKNDFANILFLSFKISFLFQVLELQSTDQSSFTIKFNMILIFNRYNNFKRSRPIPIS